VTVPLDERKPPPSPASPASVTSLTEPDDLVDPLVAPPRSPRVPGPVLLGGLAVALVVACVVATGSGAFAISPVEIVGSIGHRIGLKVGTVPGATASPTDALTDLTRPSRGARIAFSIFIASTTSSSCPRVTASPTFTFTAMTFPGIGASRPPAACARWAAR